MNQSLIFLFGHQERKDNMELKNYEINGEKIDIKDISKISNSANSIFEKECVTAILFEKPIIFSDYTVENYNMDFWHMGSLENKDLKTNSAGRKYYNIKPCNNTLYSNKCTNCVDHIYPINIRSTLRDKCIYRMSTIEWFRIIIEKINNNEPNVKAWQVNTLNSKRTIEKQLKIRFQEKEIDYLIILKDVGDKYYFITSYPVFEHKQKKELDKEYKSKDSLKIK